MTASARLLAGRAELLDELGDRLAGMSRSQLVVRAVWDVLGAPPSAAELVAFEPRRPYGRLGGQFPWTPEPGQSDHLRALAARLSEETGRRVEVWTLIRLGVDRVLAQEGVAVPADE